VVTGDEETLDLKENAGIFLRRGRVHRLENRRASRWC
jgi:mannose-6-phosphate isomerase-like protein (cupin superfamily)